MKVSLSEEDLLAKVVKEDYVKIGKKTTICLLTLENGFEIVGISAPVSVKNFNFEIGKKYAKEKAVNKLWELEGYLLQEKLNKNG